MPTAEGDPIIAEVRDVRARYAARFDFDVSAIFADLRRRQQAAGREYESRPHRVVVGVSASVKAD